MPRCPSLPTLMVVVLTAVGCGGGEAPGASGPPAEPGPPDREQLVRHHRAQLDASYWTARVDAIAGLGRLGPAASAAVPSLAGRAKAESEFEQLLALWALARIDTARTTPVLRERLERERGRLLAGDFRDVAARAAFLAAAHGGDDLPRYLDRALPELYGGARGRRGVRRGQPLLAAWALHQYGSPVTRETAAGGLRLAADSLDPDDGAYTRQLLYARLVGPPAREVLSEPLRRILAAHDFGFDFDAGKGATAHTLAVLHFPEYPAEVVEYRELVASALGSPIADHSAMDALLTLGPHGCSARTPEGIEESLERAEDDADRERAHRAREMCEGT